MKHKFSIIMCVLCIILGGYISNISAQPKYPVPIPNANAKDGVYITRDSSKASASRIKSLILDDGNTRSIYNYLLANAYMNVYGLSAGIESGALTWLNANTTNYWNICAIMNTFINNGQLVGSNITDCEDTKYANVFAGAIKTINSGCAVNNPQGSGRTVSNTTTHTAIRINDPTKKGTLYSGISLQYSCAL